MKTKQQIRSEIAAQRKAHEKRQLQKASRAIVEQIIPLKAFRSAQTVALYMAIGGEVDLTPLFEICRQLKKRTCIPVFNAENKRYDLAEIDADTALTIGHYGIAEPAEPRLIQVAEVEFFLVPGVAFDLRGNRLGRGGGYYDRLLENFEGTAAAVAFDFQIVPEVPCEEYDIPVDCIVTETKTINVCNER